jgi:hypothetical protein
MFRVDRVERLWMYCLDELFQIVTIDMSGAMGLKEFYIEMSQPVFHPVV